jgi:hypothetical protein
MPIKARILLSWDWAKELSLSIATVCDVSGAWEYKIWKKMLDELVIREASNREIRI